ncbi:MAG: TIGR03087 family PEP-CTERM/XrtA system glycosyltransferase, partial [Terriglobia bacterium]
MRILFLAHRLPYPPNKGDKIRSFWELKTLSAQHEVDLFCFYDDPADEEHVSTVSRYCRTCYAEKLSVMGSRLRALGGAAVGKPFSLGFFHSPQMAGRIREAVSNRKYDLVFAYSSPMAQYLTGISALPRILDMVDVDSLKWEQYAERAAWPYSWLWRREARNLAEFEKQVVQEFSLTLVCTEAEAESLRRMKTAGEVAALSHPLDLDYFDPEQTPLPAEIAALRPYLVFTGSMDYYPNVDGVLHFYRQVFPWLRAQIPSLRFVI